MTALDVLTTGTYHGLPTVIKVHGFVRRNQRFENNVPPVGNLSRL